MSVDLARRFVRSGAVPSLAVEEALRHWVNRGEPFLAVLVAERPEVERLLLRAAERANVPVLKRVVVLEDVMLEIPHGMCERLLAVPIRRDSRTQTVDVATADPLDPHVAREFGYQLGVPIRVLQASVSDLLAALRAVRREGVHSERTPAFGTKVARPERVIPPVHRVMSPHADPVSQAEAARGRVPSDAVIPLVRRTGDGRQSTLAPEPLASSELDAQAAHQLSLLLDQASTAEQVTEHVIEAFEGVSPRVLLLASRGAEFVGRAASAHLASERVRALRIPADSPSVLATACEAGYYLGELPPTPIHASLAHALDQPTGEVLVQAVRVGNRPALVLVCTIVTDTARATRRASAILSLAGEALERILLDRKLRG